MDNITDVCSRLRDLLEPKKRIQDLLDQKKNLDYPVNKNDLIEEKREEMAYISCKELGINYFDAEEPMDPGSFVPPEGRPEKKKVKLDYRYVWIYRSIRLVALIVLYIIAAASDIGNGYYLIMPVYVFSWFLIWVFLGEKYEAFEPKGVIQGFRYIPLLFKLPKFFKDKAAAAAYNANEYPKELEEYNRLYELKKKEYDERVSEYKKEQAVYNDKKNEFDRIREKAKERYFNDYIQTAARIEQESIEEYSRKIQEIDDKIAVINEEVHALPPVDSRILFDPDEYSYSDLKRIYDNINRGRAESLKESIQLFHEDVRREGEEENRRREARDRQWELERHNEEMARLEREKAEYAKRQAYEADERNAELERHNRETERNEKAANEIAYAQAAASSRLLCQTCKYKETCSYFITGKAKLNCTSYKSVRN